MQRSLATAGLPFTDDVVPIAQPLKRIQVALFVEQPAESEAARDKQNVGHGFTFRPDDPVGDAGGGFVPAGQSALKSFSAFSKSSRAVITGPPEW